jgi:hypothetical protein
MAGQQKWRARQGKRIGCEMLAQLEFFLVERAFTWIIWIIHEFEDVILRHMDSLLARQGDICVSRGREPAGDVQTENQSRAAAAPEFGKPKPIESPV